MIRLKLESAMPIISILVASDSMRKSANAEMAESRPAQ
jgi:hypothetical protein